MQTFVEQADAPLECQRTAVTAPRARVPELDALRGLFLVWMTLTHLPTRLSSIVNQPFGVVSSAEGFVFLSGFLVARLSANQVRENGPALRAKLWKRAFRVYQYHLVMLALAFTVVAAFAVHEHASAISNLLSFYLAHPATAIAGSVLLIYCAPLLDILPPLRDFSRVHAPDPHLYRTPRLEPHFAGQRHRMAAGAIRPARPECMLFWCS